jgi:transcriptional regulator with XRE-family HTH domain
VFKNSFQSVLGQGLKKVRKSERLTQQRVAQKSGLSIPTVRQLEHGHGNLSSFRKLLAALDLKLDGQNLPPGETLGAKVATLRRRRGISQRAISCLLAVTPQTIVSLERYNTGRLDVLEGALTVLGSGVYLIRNGTKKDFYTHAGNASVNHDWHTPMEFLERLYRVFGEFDLDPCSPTKKKSTAPVRAKMRYTAEDDGLGLPWFGTAFLNPPYGRTLGQWTMKAKEEVAIGNAQIVVALLPARTDTSYWHRDIARTAHVFFLQGRLRFGDGRQAAPFPSALVVWGGLRQDISALEEVLPDAWLQSPST